MSDDDTSAGGRERFVDLNIYVDGEKVEQLRLSKHSTFESEIWGDEDIVEIEIEVLRIVDYGSDDGGGDAMPDDTAAGGSERIASFDYDIDPDEIEVHWQHPRTEIENPVLLVWPMAVRDRWAAEVDGGVAWVVCHTTLYEDQEGDVQKVSRKVNPNEPIPWCVAEALLRYDSEYGPVETVANPYTDQGEEYENELLPDNQTTLSHAADGGTSDVVTTETERGGDAGDE